jgi:hypothetical protein
MLKKGDIILIICIVAAALAGVGWTWMGRLGGGDRIAVIKQGNKIIKTIDIDKVEKPFTVDVSAKYQETVLVEKGRIRFEDADCPDKLCVRAGWLTNKGQTAACLPNSTLIKIEGQNNEIDGGTY